MHMSKKSSIVKDDGFWLRQIFWRNGHSECDHEDKKALSSYKE